MTLEELKQRARSLVRIPEHLQLEIEDFIPNEDAPEEAEALFCWSEPEADEGIMVTLKANGDLIDLTVERAPTNATDVDLSPDERRQRAKRFITEQYPDALDTFTLTEENQFEESWRFQYEQLVGGLPLPFSGCYVNVDVVGDIVQFHYYGEKTPPVMPEQIISKEQLHRFVANHIDFQLKVVCLHKGLYEGGKDDLRLVYESVPFQFSFKADDGQPHGIPEEEEEEPTYVSVPAPLKESDTTPPTVEALVGIGPEMAIIREHKDGKQHGIVWRDRGWQGEKDDQSLEGFFDDRNAETVKAFVDIPTGRLTGFMWFKERTGNLSLSRAECWDIALQFLQKAFPDYHRFLEVQKGQSEDDADDDGERAYFRFRVHNGQGIPVYLQHVQVVVNRTTGQIDQYSGMEYDPQMLTALPAAPKTDKETAKANYFRHLDFKLQWQSDDEQEDEGFRLTYAPVHSEKRTNICFIDAMSGEVICSSKIS